MKRPKKVRIGGLDFKIIWKHKLLDEEGSVGLTAVAAQTIHISGLMPEEGRRRILLHEILHVIAWTLGIPEGEEALVTAWATGLHQVLADNPKVVDYLAGR